MELVNWKLFYPLWSKSGATRKKISNSTASIFEDAHNGNGQSLKCERKICYTEDSKHCFKKIFKKKRMEKTVNVESNQGVIITITS